MSFTIGSLFDGSGGFPLAASLCGGTPVWASEVEPYPIAVTRSRFPNMKHLGSVTDIKGAEIDPVDVITFGSPYQDLSVAGKRAGLKHENLGDEETTRSGLFMGAVRIIKEMREATNGVYPRFALWENVPGAFSSNKGEDFRTVLEELIKIVEPTAVMPAVPKNGWPYADHYCGDGWSLAYRVFDAQYWGVPQRRRRIYLVLDLGGQCAGEVSFEREGLRGYFTEGRTPWQTAARDAESGVGATDRKGNGVIIPNTSNDRHDFQPIVFTQNQRDEVRDLHGVAASLSAEPGTHQQNYILDKCSLDDQCAFRPITVSSKQQSLAVGENTANTLGANDYKEPQVVCYCLDDQGGSQISVRKDGKCPTLRAEVHGNVPRVLTSGAFCPETGGNDPSRSVAFHEELCPTLRAGFTPATVLVKPIPIHDQATRFSGKRGNNYDGKGNGLGVGNPGEAMNTLTGGDRHAVAYCIGNGQANQPFVEERTGALNCMHDQQAIVLDRAFYNQGINAQYDPQLYTDGTCPTIVAKGPAAVCVRYIVRRLTPTECARLQGFADRWAVPDEKSEFTDEEYAFWLNVRNTHAEIAGKPSKEYTKDQMLTWYNKLHTDSGEYKLWGNGIALPTALYVMQGIADAIEKAKVARSKWLDELLR